MSFKFVGFYLAYTLPTVVFLLCPIVLFIGRNRYYLYYLSIRQLQQQQAKSFFFSFLYSWQQQGSRCIWCVSGKFIFFIFLPYFITLLLVTRYFNFKKFKKNTLHHQPLILLFFLSRFLGLILWQFILGFNRVAYNAKVEEGAEITGRARTTQTCMHELFKL